MPDILAALLRPGSWILLGSGAGLALRLAGRRRLGGVALAGAGALLLALAVLPMGRLLLAPLEDRFPAPGGLASPVDAIVVLGGAFDPAVIRARGALGLNDAGERVLALAQLARRHPEARLVFAGGAGSLGDEALAALPAREFLDALGVDPDRVLLETRARNTRENALRTRELLGDVEGPVLLVTSAWHMPRAVGAFRAAGWSVVPHPVDYRTDGARGLVLGFDLRRGLDFAELAVREWLALAVYRVRGWSADWFPSP